MRQFVLCICLLFLAISQANSEEYIPAKIFENLLKESTNSALLRFQDDYSNNTQALEDWKIEFASETIAKIMDEKWCDNRTGSLGRPGFFNEGDTFRNITFLSRVPNQWKTSYGTDADAGKFLSKLINCFLRIESINGINRRGDVTRVYLRTIENLAANHKNSYFDALSGGSTCPELRDKIDRREAVQEFIPNSRYAPRALLLQTYSIIELVLNEGCKLTDPKKKRHLSSAIKAIDDAFGEYLFGKSIDGWRQVNDVAFFRIVLHLLKGEAKEAANRITQFSNSSILLQKKKLKKKEEIGTFEKMAEALYGAKFTQIHKVTKKLIPQRIFGEYVKEYLPFSDRVYIYNFIPGNKDTEVKKSYSMKQLSDLLKKAKNEINSNVTVNENMKILIGIFRGQLPNDWKITFSKLSDNDSATQLTAIACSKKLESLLPAPKCKTESNSANFTIRNLTKVLAEDIEKRMTGRKTILRKPVSLPAL